MKNVADEAIAIVEGARAGDYGENSLPRIAAYWSEYLGINVTGRDVANMMVMLKVARDQHKPKRDNHVDAIGYLILGDQCPEPTQAAPCKNCRGRGSLTYGSIPGRPLKDVPCARCKASGTEPEDTPKGTEDR